jgi:hypothetical protein
LSYGSVSKLLTRLTDIFRNYFGFPHPDARLLAYFCLSTWVADRLAMAPSLAILAPERERGIELLRLLHSLCRLPLIVAELTRTGLRALRAELSMTLLISYCDLKPSVQSLLRASSHPGLHVPAISGPTGGVICFSARARGAFWQIYESVDSNRSLDTAVCFVRRTAKVDSR